MSEKGSRCTKTEQNIDGIYITQQKGKKWKKLDDSGNSHYEWFDERKKQTLAII